MLLGCRAATAAETSSQRLTLNGVEVQLEMSSADYGVGTSAIVSWVRRAEQIVSGYYGRFPTTRLAIRLIAEPGGGVQTGKTWARGGGFIRINIGRQVTEAQLLNDWVLVHEMTHLALPDVGEEHAWLSEGAAVYVEGVARVQAGNRTQQDVFAEQFRAMPRGMPQSGDQGLDHTHTWGRTYWGGAMFCFLADVQIHQQTGNRLGLQDGLRAVLERSGGLMADWPITRVLATADAATGTHVLEELYVQMKDHPMAPDLAGLWQRLGAQRDGNEVILRDDAPLADVRRAIMQAQGNKTSS